MQGKEIFIILAFIPEYWGAVSGLSTRGHYKESQIWQ
jgi:hypothetical protein